MTGTPIGATHRERDSSYAALIRQWCFTGSPTGMPSPNGGAFGNGGAKEGARGYGFPGFGFGMLDVGMGGGELSVLFMLGRTRVGESGFDDARSKSFWIWAAYNLLGRRPGYDEAKIPQCSPLPAL